MGWRVPGVHVRVRAVLRRHARAWQGAARCATVCRSLLRGVRAARWLHSCCPAVEALIGRRRAGGNRPHWRSASPSDRPAPQSPAQRDHRLAPVGCWRSSSRAPRASGCCVAKSQRGPCAGPAPCTPAAWPPGALDVHGHAYDVDAFSPSFCRADQRSRGLGGCLELSHGRDSLW